MKTHIPKSESLNNKKWWVVSAENQHLGRLASHAAMLLRGKHQPHYTPHLDTGDFVVITNAERVGLTGRKIDQKKYFRHSTYPGGGKFTPLKEAIVQRPEWVIRKAVWGMLPHNALGRQLIRKLKIYSGPSHPHEAQKPENWEVFDRRGNLTTKIAS